MKQEKLADPILFSEIKAKELSIGVITINRPKNLNALNTECYQLINPKLLAWESDPQIAMIVIRSQNEKSFCAGGDVKNLILGIREFGLNYAKDFFTEEYFCDALISNYKKPVLAFVQGLVFGGGMGLFMAASHRIADLNTTWAMPETAIGLFPDVGGTRFLSLWPDDFGLFLGLTGARFDVQTTMLASTSIDSIKKTSLLSGTYDYKKQDEMIKELSELPWEKTTAPMKHNILNDYLGKKQLSIKEKLHESKEASQLLFEFKKYFPAKMANKDSWIYWDQTIKSAKFKHPILIDGQSRYLTASPHAARVFYKAYFRHKKKTVIETLINEWGMALEFSRNSDFDEGVRALLIDKDQKPNWQQPMAELKRFFNSKEENLLRKKLTQFGR